MRCRADETDEICPVSGAALMTSIARRWAPSVLLQLQELIVPSAVANRTAKNMRYMYSRPTSISFDGRGLFGYTFGPLTPWSDRHRSR